MKVWRSEVKDAEPMIVAIRLDYVSAIYARGRNVIKSGKTVGTLVWTAVVDGHVIELDEVRGADLHHAWLNYLGTPPDE